MNTRRRLFSYIKPYWWQFTIGLILIIAVTLVYMLPPLIIGDMIDKIKTISQPNLNLMMFGVIGLFVFKGVLTYSLNYLMSFVGQRAVTDLRNETFYHLQQMPIAYHESQRIGETISKFTNDIALIQIGFTTSLTDLLSQSLLLIFSITAAFFMNPALALITITVCPLVVFVVSKAGKGIHEISKRSQEKVANLSSILQETLLGIRVVKAFTMEDYQKNRFTKENDAGFQTNMKSVRITAILTPIIELLFAATLVLIFWYGGSQIIRGRMTTGSLIAFIAYIGAASTPLTNLSNTFSSFQRAVGAADRVFELLDQESGLGDSPTAVDLPAITGRVQFQDVFFGYRDDLPVLSRIDFEAHPGEIIALVGPSGAGKTSLINLIPRFYDPVEGRILIDGYDIREIRLRSVRTQIGLVPQESILFGVSVAENIMYGKPEASQEAVIAAAQAANAHDFIMELPEGYQTVIGERGASLSGGQRQRISIARALLRDPRILILDEATSALDTESERLVQEALERLMQNRTTFVIAHRLSTIQHAHRILVLDGGRIVEQGNHAELLVKGGLYKRLYENAGLETKKEST